MGCGSGILSIGAILLGADRAVAVDIEENAAETAMENAVKNNIRMHEVIDALEGVGFKDPEINVKEGWAAVRFTAPV